MIQIYILDVLLSLWFTCAILDWEINFLAICAMSLSLQQRLSSEVLWFVGLWVLTREDKYFQSYLRNDMKEEEVNLTEPWRKICSINYHFVKPLIISHQLVSNSCITLSQWRLRGIIFRIHTIFRPWNTNIVRKTHFTHKICISQQNCIMGRCLFLIMWD